MAPGKVPLERLIEDRVSLKIPAYDQDFTLQDPQNPHESLAPLQMTFKAEL